MEFFNNAKAVRLKSHIDKYLIADEDEESVRQSRNGSTKKARWLVESVPGDPHLIRLKSCHGKYLCASDDAFLLGMTGKKVVQALTFSKRDATIEWEPIKEGHGIRLRTKGGGLLRANGATPPWRNSVTHDLPQRTATQVWVLWEVEVVDISQFDAVEYLLPSYLSGDTSSVSSLINDENNNSTIAHSQSMPEKRLSLLSSKSGSSSPLSSSSPKGPKRTWLTSMRSERLMESTSLPASPRYQSSGMEFFKKAKSVRLRSHHNKYLIADDDHEKVVQERDKSSKTATWTVELVEDFENVVRLKSCFGKYLTATDDQFLLGVTGRCVKQTMPRKLDSYVEWEPVRDGVQVKMKTRYGNYLRANGGVPPWRNSVTHDIPHRHGDWILWDVEVVEMRREPPKKIQKSEEVDEDVDLSKFALTTPGFSSHTSFDSQDGSPMKSEGRTVYYRVAEDENKDNAAEELSFLFKGHGLEELTESLEEKTGHENIIVCLRNKFNGQLYPLCLSLPPNNATMHVVVVPSTSKLAADFLPKSST